MPVKKTQRGLTPSEAEFVRRYVRVDESADHIAAFKDCRLDGCELDGGKLTSAMKRFMNRKDVKFAISTESLRVDMVKVKAHREADAIEAQGIVSDAEGRQIVKDTLLLSIVDERGKLNDDETRSMQGMSKAAEVYGKLTAQDGNAPQEVSDSDLKSALATLGKSDGATEREGRTVPAGDAAKPETFVQRERLAQ